MNDICVRIDDPPGPPQPIRTHSPRPWTDRSIKIMLGRVSKVTHTDKYVKQGVF